MSQSIVMAQGRSSSFLLSSPALEASTGASLSFGGATIPYHPRTTITPTGLFGAPARGRWLRWLDDRVTSVEVNVVALFSGRRGAPCTGLPFLHSALLFPPQEAADGHSLFVKKEPEGQQTSGGRVRYISDEHAPLRVFEGLAKTTSKTADQQQAKQQKRVDSSSPIISTKYSRRQKRSSDDALRHVCVHWRHRELLGGHGADQGAGPKLQRHRRASGGGVDSGQGVGGATRPPDVLFLGDHDDGGVPESDSSNHWFRE